MIVLLLEKVSPSLRGELTRWLMEPKTGVFVGKVSALVREKLWEKCTKSLKPGAAAVLIHRAPSEQGFTVRSIGDRRRSIVDIEGLWLVQRLKPNATE